MAGKGNKIVCCANPRGVFLEGIVDGTPLPGTIMQIKAATAADGTGRHTWEAFNADADGNQRLIAVLREDELQGKTADDAYVDGDRCFLYFPLPGEDINVRWSAAGTGGSDAVAVGDLGIINDGDGLVIDTTGSPEAEPFIALEAVADVTATGTLVWSMFTGY